jgi:hypothetical protein
MRNSSAQIEELIRRKSGDRSGGSSADRPPFWALKKAAARLAGVAIQQAAVAAMGDGSDDEMMVSRHPAHLVDTAQSSVRNPAGIRSHYLPTWAVI